MNSETISIIIPVLNEAKNLHTTLSHLPLTNNEELIVVDGGSSDDTISIAREYTKKVFSTKTGRARVMNFGAEKAEGSIFLFLHADCFLPENGLDIIRNTLHNNAIAAGGFYLNIDSPGVGFRVIERAANIRHRVTSLIYGDQGIFMRKSVFEQIGGYADIPLMEDIDISRRLKKMGKIVFVRPPIKVSPRRWLKEGLFYTTLRDWSIAFAFTFLKISPERLIKYYGDIR